MSFALTPVQKNVLDFIRMNIEDTETAPTFEEIMAYTGHKSKSQIHRILCCLEDRGHIVRLPKSGRGIELVRRDCPHCGGPLQ